MDNVIDELEYLKKRNKLFRDLEDMAENRGFLKVESDFFEEYISYSKMNQTQNLKSLVKIQDMKGNVFLLKPDVTSNIIKQVIPRITKGTMVDFYYSDTVFRFDKSGGIKSIRQFGVEVIGRKDIQSDIKLLQFIIEILDTYKLDYFLEIGNQRFMSIICKELGLNISEITQLKKILTRKNIHELSSFIEDRGNLGYRALLSSILKNQNDMDTYIKIIKDYNLNNALLKELQKLIKMKELLNNERIYIDLSLINEFDYYNGPIYKGYIKNHNREILSGGRYDYLTKDYGKETPALGFTLDLSILMNEVIS